eukprot:NODE_30_length_37342_cov_0.449507.p7 type:complete len:444 gc:universal NODE_30_length_37342_cov_0.449507:35353-36684(+)
MCGDTSKNININKKQRKEWVRHIYPKTLPEVFVRDRADTVESMTKQLRDSDYILASGRASQEYYFENTINPFFHSRLITMAAKCESNDENLIGRALKARLGVVHEFNDFEQLLEKRNELLKGPHKYHHRITASETIKQIEILLQYQVMYSEDTFTESLFNLSSRFLKAALHNCKYSHRFDIPKSDILGTIENLILLFIDGQIGYDLNEKDLPIKPQILRIKSNYEIFTLEKYDNVIRITIDSISSLMSQFKMDEKKSCELSPFPNYNDIIQMNSQQMNQVLIKYQDGQDYLGYIKLVSKAFYKRYLEVSADPDIFMADLELMLIYHPATYVHFTDLITLNPECKNNPIFKEVGLKMLVSYTGYLYSGITTTQIICICHYFYHVDMGTEDLEMLELFLNEHELAEHPIIRAYMIQFGFSILEKSANSEDDDVWMLNDIKEILQE